MMSWCLTRDCLITWIFLFLSLSDVLTETVNLLLRFASVHEEIRRLRPPRRFFKDRIIRPYHHQEAEGYAILMVCMADLVFLVSGITLSALM